MTVIEELKSKALQLRKDRDPIAPKIVFAISEVEKIGKNAGNRETTNDEAIKVVQKIVSVIDENLKHSKGDELTGALEKEKKILVDLLPAMLTKEETVASLEEVLSVTSNRGEIMKQLKMKHGSLIDLKMVNEILKEKGCA